MKSKPIVSKTFKTAVNLFCRKKLKADTLVEVIISMLIIMVVFVVAIGIFTKVTLSSFSTTSTIVHTQMNHILQEAVRTNILEARTINQDSIIYEQTVSSYENYTDVLSLKVEAFQNQKSIGKLQRLVTKRDDEQ